ncbi:hypothetical protein E2C01_012803 [Portunus trituberculatus]|uniref:Uncharacterized protein n=1 Tax=Portunus trituberculatus TaxID=210409 RepID=A0A5B7DEK4_PORTR|nr:hypothetical protein [Portunus trituberculatus]
MNGRLPETSQCACRERVLGAGSKKVGQRGREGKAEVMSGRVWGVRETSQCGCHRATPYGS